MEKISACLVVHNEEKLIGRCLSSLTGVVDEIILIHDGECQDRTLEIARQYGAKIFVRPYIGEAEGQRPFGFQQALNNWILQIDADEFLSLESRDGLNGLVNNNLDIAAYELLWPLWDGYKAIRANWPHKRCLFRKDKISFLGIVHFIPQVQGKVIKINLRLHHQPDYNNFSYESFIKKQLPWAQLQASHYLKNFSEIEKFNWPGNTWPQTIIYRRKFPLLLLPLEFLLVSSKNLFSGAYRAGRVGIKASIMAGLYRAMVNYYIFKLKK
jgi:glycosyltransferase involved in cell wall biosynthesis